VADDFIDIGTPLKQMADVAVAPLGRTDCWVHFSLFNLITFPGSPNRQGNFEDKARKFDVHARRLADTASRLATAGGCRNRNTIEGIQSHASLVCV
jgi:vinculin